MNNATIMKDNYAYKGADEAAACVWLEQPDIGLANGNVKELAAGTMVEVLGDPVSSEKFDLIVGVGAIQNQYGEDVTSFIPVAIPTASGKWWIPVTATNDTLENVAQDSGNGDSAADGTSTAQTNQPGNGGGAGGTDQHGSPLNGNPADNTSGGIFDGLTKGDKWNIALGAIGIAIAIYYAKRRK